MKQIRITKRHPSENQAPEPLPLDPRDPDIVRAKLIARLSQSPRAAASLRNSSEAPINGTGQ